MWIDPRDGETPFGTFATELLDALAPRLEPGTLAKYKSHLDSQLLPQWSAWPMIGIFNNYVEIEKWVSELHDDYAESTVSSIFATFSTVTNAAVRARCIPANPCSGIRVTRVPMSQTDWSRIQCKPSAPPCACTTPQAWQE
jgi:hypothetical protein